MKLYLWPCLDPGNFSIQGRSKHSRVFRPKEFFEPGPQPSKVLCGLRNPWRRRRAPGGGGGGGMFEVNVSAGGLPEVVECSRWTCLPEVCRKCTKFESARSAGGRKCTKFESARSAGGRPDVYQVREPTTTTNARREVLITHCGLKVHSHYSV